MPTATFRPSGYPQPSLYPLLNISNMSKRLPQLSPHQRINSWSVAGANVNSNSNNHHLNRSSSNNSNFNNRHLCRFSPRSKNHHSFRPQHLSNRPHQPLIRRSSSNIPTPHELVH